MKEFKMTLEARKRHNEQLIRRMKSGEPLWSYDSKASWFPPRPMIEKDPEAIKRLYQTSVQTTVMASDLTSGRHIEPGYKDPTVRHIENRLKIIASNVDKKSEKIG